MRAEAWKAPALCVWVAKVCGGKPGSRARCAGRPRFGSVSVRHLKGYVWVGCGWGSEAVGVAFSGCVKRKKKDKRAMKNGSCKEGRKGRWDDMMLKG